MKKIEKLKLMELTSEEKGKILGGCYVDAWGNAHCCVGTNQASIPPTTGYPSTSYPSQPPKPTTCGSTCMPGDNADFANWIGTKLANQYL